MYLSKFQLNDVFQSQKIVCILTNSADPDEMPSYVEFHLGDSLQKKSVLYAAMKGLADEPPVTSKQQLLSSAAILCKQFGLNQTQQNVGPDLN